MTRLDALSLAIDNADYRDPRDAGDLVMLLDAYSRDPMGGGKSLEPGVRSVLAMRLAEVPGAFSFLARLDDEPVGLANCFMQFSTFAAQPVVNVHDVFVLQRYRGRGIAAALLGCAEKVATDRGACKITLEVLSGNLPAQSLYTSLGYCDFQLDPSAGSAMFWQKRLS